MSNNDDKPIVLGTVAGFRGNQGEVTVKVVSGDAARWAHVTRVLLDGGAGGGSEWREVTSARAYRDRLVLKLFGLDDANQAAALRGREVRAADGEVPELPRNEYWVERLVGAQVKDAMSGYVGRVMDVVATGGIDLLLVQDDAGVETLVPLAKEFIREVDEAAGTITVTLPEGLRGLNAGGGDAS